MTDDVLTAEIGTFDQDTARRFCHALSDTVDALIAVLEEETRLIRSAKLAEAFAMGEEKSAISERYSRAHATLRRSGQVIGRCAPVEIDHLRRRHGALESAISSNLAVLATARTVSETLIRGAAELVARSDCTPSGYGADASRTASQGMAAPVRCNVAL